MTRATLIEKILKSEEFKKVEVFYNTDDFISVDGKVHIRLSDDILSIEKIENSSLYNISADIRGIALISSISSFKIMKNDEHYTVKINKIEIPLMF